MTTHVLDFTAPEPDEARPHIGMAPLVDIVLLLICFYLLVMQSIQSHVDENVELPRVANNQTTEVKPAELVINIDAAGGITFNGRGVDDAALRNLLHAEQAKSLESGRPVSAVIRADARQRYDLLDDALAACRDAGIAAVTVRTQEIR